MKKLLCILLSLVILGSFAACGTTDGAGSSTVKDPGSPTVEDSAGATISGAEVGDVITFGSYEQDNVADNGTEEIEWIVLDKQDRKILVISKYGLDCQQYCTEYSSVTWETSPLRTWLNGDFYNTAFREDQKDWIETAAVSAEDNEEYATDAGNDTSDKVFLLSINEAAQYFSTDVSRICKPTEYAKAQGAYIDSGNGNCYWWLRSPGDNSCNVAYVNCAGGIYDDGDDVRYGDHTVRPAMWIDLAAIAE